MCANAIDDHHNESAVVHIQPIISADQLICRVPHKWTIWIDAEVWFVKASMNRKTQSYNSVV